MRHRVDPMKLQEFNCPFGQTGSLLTVVVGVTTQTSSPKSRPDD